jgi:DNA-binding ferritin-like protein
MNLSIKVNALLQAQIQFKILHWQTKGYARHMAFGDMYEQLDGLIDEYVETAMGKWGRFVVDGQTNTITYQNLKDVNVVDFLQDFKSKLWSLTDELDQQKDTDLLNLRDEILGKTNKLAYLLTLD